MRKRISFYHFGDFKGKSVSLSIPPFAWIVRYHRFWNRWEFIFAISDFRKKPKDIFLGRVAVTIEVGK